MTDPLRILDITGLLGTGVMRQALELAHGAAYDSPPRPVVVVAPLASHSWLRHEIDHLRLRFPVGLWLTTPRRFAAEVPVEEIDDRAVVVVDRQAWRGSGTRKEDAKALGWWLADVSVLLLVRRASHETGKLEQEVLRRLRQRLALEKREFIVETARDLPDSVRDIVGDRADALDRIFERLPDMPGYAEFLLRFTDTPLEYACSGCAQRLPARFTSGRPTGSPNPYGCAGRSQWHRWFLDTERQDPATLDTSNDERTD